MSEEINIKKIYTDCPEVLDILLYDNTTKKNIIWATDHYAKKGLGYSITNEIKPCHLTGKVRAIRPRIEKSKTEQVKRSRDNAEVFTPSWIVNKQNNLADNAWFGEQKEYCPKEYDSIKSTWYTNGFKKGYESGVNAPIKKEQCGYDDGVKFVEEVKKKFGKDIKYINSTRTIIENFEKTYLNDINNIPVKYRGMLYKRSFVSSISENWICVI